MSSSWKTIMAGGRHIRGPYTITHEGIGFGDWRLEVGGIRYGTFKTLKQAKAAASRNERTRRSQSTLIEGYKRHLDRRDPARHRRPSRKEMIAALGLESETRHRGMTGVAIGRYGASTAEFWQKIKHGKGSAHAEARRRLGLSASDPRRRARSRR